MYNTLKQFMWLFVALTLLIVNQAFGHGMSEVEKQSILEGGNLSYLKLGITHMLSGFDHLLFVFGIVFFLSKFKDVVKFITAFTLGHSVTLILATFAGIQINYFLIDAIIALSVCYIGFSNLNGFKELLDIKQPNLLMMITGLGLIHGIGLSTRLQQLPLSEDNLLMNIISFNVGIELGQIAALAFMLILLAGWRKADSFKVFSKIANIALILAGLYLFMMQMHGYSHTSKPDEFGFSSDNHYHEHLKMNANKISTSAKKNDDHGHAHEPVTDSSLSKSAAKKITQLANEGKIERSWLGLEPSSISKKDYINGPEWVVSFKNAEISDSSKNNLYVFYDLNGHYIAANHSGE